MNTQFVKLAFLLVVGLLLSQIHAKSPNPRDGNVTFEEFKAATNNASILIIDVRQAVELQDTGVIPSSINIPRK